MRTFITKSFSNKTSSGFKPMINEKEFKKLVAYTQLIKEEQFNTYKHEDTELERTVKKIFRLHLREEMHLISETPEELNSYINSLI